MKSSWNQVALIALVALAIAVGWRTFLIAPESVRSDVVRWSVPPAGGVQVSGASEGVAAPPSADRAHLVGWSLAERSPASVAAPTPIDPRDVREASLEGASLVNLATLTPGTMIELPLPGAVPLMGRVNLLQHELDGMIRVGGSVTGSAGGSFSLAGRGVLAAGRVLLPERALAYDIIVDGTGQPVLRERPLSEMLCFRLPRPPEEPMALPAAPGPEAIPPVLSSRPNATAVLYLDFDGETVTDPDWNGGNPIVAAASTLSASEITTVWQRVKEDYWPFNIDVTTDPARYNGAPVGRRMRCIITPTSAWYGSSGGVAFRDSFARAGTVSFSSTIPCWVFNSGVVSAAEAISHELGHTFGLKHDGDLSQPVGSANREYYHGHGSAPVSWGAIMGSSYSRNVVQWSKGEYLNANNPEDDLAIITNATNGFGYVADDAGDDRARATALGVIAGVVNQPGTIGSSSDVDCYVFNCPAGNLNLTASPAEVSPNLDLALELLDVNGNVLVAANPDTALSASILYQAAGGTYYLQLRGTGRGTILGDGYSSYGSIGQYTISGTLPSSSPPVIATHPVSQAAVGGASVSFTVAATSALPLTFQWYFNGAPISGATNASLPLTNLSAANAGYYHAIVSDGQLGATSNVAALTVRALGSTGAQYVAVGEGGVIRTSADATNWTQRTSGSGWRLRSVAASANLLVVVGEAGSILTSPEGVNWTARVSGVVDTLRGVAFGPNRFVAVGGAGSSVIRTSSDGIVWSGASVVPALGRLRAVCWGTSQYLAVGAAGTVLSSVDGLVWTQRSCGASERLDGVVWTGSQFQILGETGNIYSSTDGITWSAVQSNPAPWVEGLTWSNSRYVVVGAGGVAAQSPSGAFWSSTNTGGTGTLHGIVWTGAVMTPSNTPLALMENLRMAPTFTANPEDRLIFSGQTASLSVSVAGTGPFTYQWYRNGEPLPGEASSTLSLPDFQAAQAGSYTVVVSNSFGNARSTAASLALAPRGLFNQSVLTHMDVAAPELQASFVIEGATAKQMLIRAVGPALTSLGVVGAMANPRLDITHANTGVLVASNDQWGAAANAAQVPGVTASVGAFALANGSQDAVVLASFPPGTYRASVTGVGASAGSALVEIYDADATPRLVYLSSRLRAGGGASAIVGFVIAVPGSSQYLIRAVGSSSLFSAGMIGNPALSLFSGNTLIGSNDDWGNSASAPGIAAAAAWGGVQPLMGNSTDSALLMTLSPGSYTAQVSGVDAAAGLVLLEICAIDNLRASSMAPAIVSPPTPIAVGGPGQPMSAYFGVSAIGKPQPSYQWRRNGLPIAGATGYSYIISNPQPGDAGSYDVLVSNASGSVISDAAGLTVNGITEFGTHSVVGTGYVAGGTVTITNTLNYSGTASSLGWSVSLPAGWSFAGDGGSAGQVKPIAGTTGTLEWAWSTIPGSPVKFTYTVNVPPGETATRTLAATAIVRSASVLNLIVSPNPLPVPVAIGTHDADTNRDFRLSLVELTRVIELYNVRNATVRTGCYRLQEGSEDGFAPEPARVGGSATLPKYHSADSNRDGNLSLLELTRVIEFFNHRAGTSRTGDYHVHPGSEDGFGPGPALVHPGK